MSAREWETDLDHSHTDDPVCPHCQYVIEPCDLFRNTQSDETEIDCPSCEQPVCITRSVSVSYTTYKRESTPGAPQ